MKIIGLTGGIASGKSFVAEIFKKKGAMIFDADEEVHKLLELDKSTILAIKKKFPTSFIDRKIDRKILGKIVFSEDGICQSRLEPEHLEGSPQGASSLVRRNNKKHKRNLQILEQIIHPKVRKKYLAFLKEAHRKSAKLTVLNIPLLLEKQSENGVYKCDKIVAILSPKPIRKKRFLERAKKADSKNFSSEKKNLEKKFEVIFSKQTTDSERKKMADFVIRNNGIESLAKQIEEVMNYAKTDA